MVTKIPLLLLLVSLFAVACGGGGNSSSSSTMPTRTPAQSIAPANTPSGPQAEVSPHAGPPGIEVTVTGRGWEPGVLIDVTGQLQPGVTAKPYETVVSGADGSFTAKFRLEAAPDGTTLSTGRYNLIARSASNQLTIPFLVETRRPVGATGPNG